MKKIKTRHTLKKALVAIPVYGTGHANKSDEFWERFQTDVDPHPHISELYLSLKIMRIYFILSGHHTSYSIPILFFCGSQTACDIDGDFLSCLWWSTTLIYHVVLKGKAPLNISKSFLLVILSLMRNFLKWKNVSELYLLLVYIFLINWSGPKYANPVLWWRLC